MNVKVVISDFILRFSLSINQALILTKVSFFYTMLVFTQSNSGLLGDIDEFIQLIPGNYIFEKPIKITGVQKSDLKCDCVNGSIVNGIPETNFYGFALDKPPCQQIYKEPRVKFFERSNESVLSHITFYLEDDDHKAVVFNEGTIFLLVNYIKELFPYKGTVPI